MLFKKQKIVLTDVFEVHIIELPKIKRLMKNCKISEEEKELAKWIKFLLNPEELGEMDMNENKELKKAKTELDNLQKDEYEQRMAELRMKHIMDSKAIEDYGYDKGLEEGLKQGIEQGIEEGIKEGLKQGIEQGKEEGEKNAKIEIARKLLQKGKNIEEIMELTNLKREDIENM